MRPIAAQQEDYLRQKELRVRARAAGRRPRTDERMRAEALRLPRACDFGAMLVAGDRVALIAEFKRRSPASGALPGAHEHPAEVAAVYLKAGAGALSVLTDEEDFGGSLEDLRAVCGACGPALPVLRKDFLVDRSEIIEARLAGAAAVLLIVDMLRDAELAMLLEEAVSLNIAALVEVHDEADLDRALAAGARIVGINNRNLRTLATNLRVTEQLAPRVPGGVVVVSESGIRSARDVERARDAGAHAVLVGDALLRVGGAQRSELVHALAGVQR